MWYYDIREFSRPFNSRPHEEVDNNCSICRFIHISFNSRPHEEVDSLVAVEVDKDNLSIHDLTRRSTIPSNTAQIATQSFNSRPHEEVDRHTHFAFVFHFLSIHDLTRRSTLTVIPSVIELTVFQFTTSRGGRLH